MRRNSDGTVTLDLSELRLIRAALFTIEHYADQVWDRQEVHAISGYARDQFRQARREIDDLTTDDDRGAAAINRVLVNLDLFESLDDGWFTQPRRLRALHAVIDEAQSLSLPISRRLLSLDER
jgi:hypothetical protein